MRLTAKSSLGFSGPGGLTASFKRFVNGCSSLLVSHFLLNLSDKLIPPRHKGYVKQSYTLLTWLKYAGIYVELYGLAKAVLGFNSLIKRPRC